MSHFFAELKRRKVFHTAVAYAVVGTGIWGASDVGVEALGLPDVVLTTIVVATLFGFPVALVLAWFFEVRPETPATEHAAADPGQAPARRLRWGLVGAGVTVVAVATAAFVLLRPGGLSGAVIQEGAQIVIAEFEASEANAELALTAHNLVRIAFEHTPYVRVVTPASIRDALGRMERADSALLTPEIAHEIAARDGYEGVLEGEVTAAGAGWVVALQLTASVSGEVLVAEAETLADADDVTAGIERLVDRVRSSLGETAASIESVPGLPALTTSSLPALVAMARAQQAWVSGGGDPMTYVREALEIDSTFVMAKVRLATSMAPGSDRITAARMLRDLYPQRHGLTPGERADFMWAYHELVTGDLEAGVRAVEDYLAERPDAALDHQWQIGLSAMLTRDWPRAERLLRPLADESPHLADNLSAVLMVQGKLDEISARLEEGRGGLWRTYLRIPAALEDWDELTRAAEEHRAEFNEVEPFILGMIANGATGRLAAAERALALLREVRPDLADEWAVRYFATVDLLHRADTAAALARIPTGRTASASPEWPLKLAQLYGEAGDAVTGRRLLDEYDESTDSLARVAFRSTRLAAEARVLLAEDRPRAALAPLGRLDTSGASWAADCTHCYLATMAQAYEALSMPDSAAARYEEFLGTHWWFSDFRHWKVPRLVPMHERLGELYEELGRPDDALRHYRKVVEDWAEADELLQPRLEAARAAIVRLEGDVR